MLIDFPAWLCVSDRPPGFGQVACGTQVHLEPPTDVR